ncbi:acyltransferase [Caulobacter sp. S45]|uniref:acyltransferase n=1 Tax=Caulobacter sp. S45 TaxID=1641861 RepID=UPI0015757419|nr:acyltransferase [Caulobacter sp. S45]
MYEEYSRALIQRLAPIASGSQQRTPVLPTLKGLERVEAGLPDWWLAGGNVLLLPPNSEKPALECNPHNPPTSAIVALNGLALPAHVMLWGEAPFIFIGEGARMPNAHLFCGDASGIVIADNTGATWSPWLDARNGGLIYVGPDGLFASNVRLQTDDMHAIRDAAGQRVNAFGGRIVIERHVWLGDDVLILGGAHIGSDAIVGARSVVKGRIEPNTVSAGVPAREVRSNVTWDHRDLP